MKTEMIERQTLYTGGSSHFGACLPVVTHGSELGAFTRVLDKDETRGSLPTASASLQGKIT